MLLHCGITPLSPSRHLAPCHSPTVTTSASVALALRLRVGTLLPPAANSAKPAAPSAPEKPWIPLEPGETGLTDRVCLLRGEYITPNSFVMQYGQLAGSEDGGLVWLGSALLICTKHSVQMGCPQHRVLFNAVGKVYRPARDAASERPIHRARGRSGYDGATAHQKANGTLGGRSCDCVLLCCKVPIPILPLVIIVHCGVEGT